MSLKLKCVQQESGFITYLILVLLTTFSILGVDVYLKSQAENRIAKRVAQSCQAVYLAEGGIEWAKAQLRLNQGWTGGVLTLSGNKANVSVKNTGSGFEVISEAKIGLAARKIKVLIIPDGGKWLTKNYQELHD